MYMGMVMLTTTSLAKVEVTKILMTGSCTKERFSVKAITKSRPLFVLIARGDFKDDVSRSNDNNDSRWKLEVEWIILVG